MTGIWEHLVPQPKPYIGSFCYRYSINNLSLPDPGVPGVRSMGSGVSIYVTPRPFWNFAYVTLADDDTNPILADDANRAIWRWLSSFMMVVDWIYLAISTHPYKQTDESIRTWLYYISKCPQWKPGPGLFSAPYLPLRLGFCLMQWHYQDVRSVVVE